MKQLQINDQDAQRLIKMLKNIFDDHNIDLSVQPEGVIKIEGSGDISFILDYKYAASKTSFNFRETKYNYTLLRINLNDNFHKNADGTRVSGPRINVFSEKEFEDKGDNHTHYKAYPLPYDTIPKSNDFYEVLIELLKYTNTNNSDKISFQQSIISI
ncbi:hypothetical protein QP248_02835 [Aerococcus sp. UMB8608]|uniref:Uncharacterized protein n=1 Tax=Aerococcus sanguinicola TaxID=119206 RepID=A0A0X8F9J9_9LACT|nr:MULTISPECIES: hypothetical protein [Aerococcus]AMB93287.1 hypothetical protein AWM72_00125 [Aerococcus sanguinicola]MDK6679386.1 hypothetical protein [Aerococcus sp. UMB8608]MDK6685772.1 hypothetical protein [Aerococcus sp. UMB8623]OFT95919.1 hypothetical protein HMPREF3090_03605 [Aerococcus sp. HMSC23C02]